MWKTIVIALTVILAGIALLFLQVFELNSSRNYVFTGITAVLFLISLFVLEFFVSKKALKK